MALNGVGPGDRRSVGDLVTALCSLDRKIPEEHQQWAGRLADRVFSVSRPDAWPTLIMSVSHDSSASRRMTYLRAMRERLQDDLGETITLDALTGPNASECLAWSPSSR